MVIIEKGGRLTFFAELDYVFAVPTRKHMSFAVSQQAPHWFKSFVLRRKGLPKPQLYKIEEDTLDGDEKYVDAKVHNV